VFVVGTIDGRPVRGAWSFDKMERKLGFNATMFGLH
jgi:hypothetical protein